MFRQLKLEYKEYIILFKSGIFYVSFDEDAIILNKIFNFKINELKNNIKVGFPINSLEKYIKNLGHLNINYLIISNKEIVSKISFDENNYNKYEQSVFNTISINNKLRNICEFIKSISDIEIKRKIIDKIDNILDGYKRN